METIKDTIKKLSPDSFTKRIIRETQNPPFDEFRDYFIQTAQTYFCNYQTTGEIDKLLSYMYSYLFEDSFISIDPETNKEITGQGINKGIFIAGPTGTGKTTFLRVLFKVVETFKLRYLYNEKLYYIKPRQTSELQIRNEYNKTGEFYYIDSATLFIDDIGQGYKVKCMGTDFNPVEEIILTRYDQYPHTLTFFTSNYPINSPKLVEFYGVRAADRMAAMCNYYILKETNFRKVYR